MSKNRSSTYIRTARRSFLRPPAGSVFEVGEVPLVIDAPPAVIRRAIARGALRTFKVDGVELVDGEDLGRFVQAWDDTVTEALQSTPVGVATPDWPKAA